ncbi:MAG: hypothetical protein C0596_07550 [Marinilabiliales bacterium]|nr:MAG: hypothetical protein C0596_07550 [Marinilabiliales bacterium]
MKRKLLKLILLCISVFIYTLAGAQENFGDPIDIGVVNGVYECGAIYSHSDNSCNYVDDVAGTNGAPDVVYQFELTADATVLMSMCNGTSYDSYLYLFDGSETLVTSNDDACGVYSEIEASITAGTYYVVVDGFSTSCGSYTLEVSIAGEDITPPVPQAGSLPDLLDPCMIASVVPPFADDNCVGLIVGTTETSFPIYGSTTITWSFEDLYGNISTQDQIVIIGDSDPPVPDLVSLDDVVGECNIDDPIAPTATDACGGPVTVTHDAALPIAQGTTVVTWTYEDANGNSVTQTQNFILNDLEDPTITCPPEITLETDVDACEASTTSENVYYISSAQLVGVDYNGPICNGTPDAWVCGDSFELTWNSEETNIPIGVDVEFYQSYNDNFGALPLFFNGIPDDNYEGPIESCVNNLVSVTLNPSSYNVGGLNSIIINSFDECLVLDQNPAWCMDVYAKVIVYTINSSIGEPIAEDNCGIEIIVNDVLPTLTLGTHTVEWMAIDQVGNFATCTQEVTVVDATPPVPDLAVLPDVMDECEVTVLIDPTATDACGGVVTVTNDAVLPINTQGTTVVTWYYEDEFGNISSQTQNIVIDDITDPIQDLAVLPDLNDPCAITSLTPPTATDNCGGMVTVTHDATLPIYGSGVITWTYDDGNGNTATQTQTVIVDDVDAPVPDLAVLDDITAECEITSLEEPTAIDACGGEVTVTNDAVLPITAQGTTVVTWTYTDDNLNSVTKTQNVILTDVTEPVPDLADLPDITADCEVTSLVDTNVTDNCGGTVIITNDAVLPITGEGTTTVVTWTYDDGNGNIATQTQNVIIEDLTPPVPDVSLGEPSNIEIVIVDLYGIADEIGWELRDASDVVIISGGPGATGTYIASSMNGPYTFIAETQGYWNDNSFSFDLSCNGTNFLSGSITGGQYLTYTDLETCGQESYYELPEYVMECGETVSAIPTATDACTGSITGITTYPLEYADLGTYTIAWDYEDGNGNTLTQIQDVIVTDLTGPVPDLAVLDPVSGSCEVT